MNSLLKTALDLTNVFARQIEGFRRRFGSHSFYGNRFKRVKVLLGNLILEERNKLTAKNRLFLFILFSCDVLDVNRFGVSLFRLLLLVVDLSA